MTKATAPGFVDSTRTPPNNDDFPTFRRQSSRPDRRNFDDSRAVLKLLRFVLSFLQKSIVQGAERDSIITIKERSKVVAEGLYLSLSFLEQRSKFSRVVIRERAHGRKTGRFIFTHERLCVSFSHSPGRTRLLRARTP